MRPALDPHQRPVAHLLRVDRSGAGERRDRGLPL